MLKIDNLMAEYSGNYALRGISLEVNRGEIVCLIGANGAGKTTLLNCISGVHRSKSGEIFFNDGNISHSSTQTAVKLGIIQVPENRQLFHPLTVLENLELGAYLRAGTMKSAQMRNEIAGILERFPALKPKLYQRAGTLSGGEQQMVAIARALMGKPELLLLDEPSLGLAPLIVKEIFRIIQDLRSEGKTILLVEQNALGALAISDRAYVMETGCINQSGRAADLIQNGSIKRAFLGQDIA